jgi:hypothetical protein
MARHAHACLLKTILILLAALAFSAPSDVVVVGQQAPRYTVSRTEYGHPDFQGIWATEFLTRLERPPAVEGLVATPEQAETMVAGIRKQLSLSTAVLDPDVYLHDIKQLAMVKGEYRTSIIVDPKNGRIPFTKAGLDLLASIGNRDITKFDGPEQRPLTDRCLENMTAPPIRTLPVFLPRQIIQNHDYVVILAEDVPGPRIIHLTGGKAPPDVLRSIGGYSTGRWERETLVVRTTHIRTDDPTRSVAGRSLLLGPRTEITERFTRVSATELVYQFTVEDNDLYTQAWSGEFSLTRFNGKIYEYACHEGNYSLPNTLRGGQAAETRGAEPKSNQH